LRHRHQRAGGEIVRWMFEAYASGTGIHTIVSQELFDQVQARMQEIREKYRHPLTHYVLRGLVECGECGAGFSSYRRYVGKQLTTGNRRIHHKAAYKCNFRPHECMHARENITHCHIRKSPLTFWKMRCSTSSASICSIQ
jgi:hypothetical protein